MTCTRSNIGASLWLRERRYAAEMQRATIGPLVLTGGAEFTPGNEPQDRAFLAAAGGRPVYVVATAAVRQDPDRAVATALRWFRSLGADVEELRLRGRREGSDPAIAAAASDAGGIYLCGGDPGLVVELLRGTRAWGAVVRAWRNGAALGGSSAGAMALGEWSLIRAGMSHDRRRFAPALGLLRNVAVVPHLDEFGERWLPSLRPPHPDTTLLGLDTRTAAVWRPGVGWRAMGPGRVVVIRGSARAVTTDGGRPTGIGRPRPPSRS
jgi:cyanophycinase